MPSFLVFRLFGPISAWGDIAVGERRPIRIIRPSRGYWDSWQRHSGFGVTRPVRSPDYTEATASLRWWMRREFSCPTTTRSKSLRPRKAANSQLVAMS